MSGGKPPFPTCKFARAILPLRAQKVISQRKSFQTRPFFLMAGVGNARGLMSVLTTTYSELALQESSASLPSVINLGSTRVQLP